MNTFSFSLLQFFIILLSILIYPNWVIATQACQPNIIKTGIDTRYQNNADGTITDLNNGLMWQQCNMGQSGADCTLGADSTYTWDAALQIVEQINTNDGFASYTDWRLPNIKELFSLVEVACSSPSINLTFFPNSGLAYWSSTPANGTNGRSWILNFDEGNNSTTDRNLEHIVRLVRGGPQ